MHVPYAETTPRGGTIRLPQFLQYLRNSNQHRRRHQQQQQHQHQHQQQQQPQLRKNVPNISPVRGMRVSQSVISSYQPRDHSHYSLRSVVSHARPGHLSSSDSVNKWLAEQRLSNMH
ncbi:hypothetical protein EV182_000830 [Spiromyces aspiralis]|uniref:Uncharacterized protein n=1 Tax=Spiromyces aspiralis TaxID=68401 RepID=A0ACC1HIU8_9FUNG|nr:hypothetical protein EV182_000830 [Spiromyces aspiralis]